MTDESERIRFGSPVQGNMKESTMNLVSKLIKTVVPVFLLVFAAGCASPGTPQPTISVPIGDGGNPSPLGEAKIV